MTTDELRSRLEDINDKLHLSVYEDTGNPSDVAITELSIRRNTWRKKRQQQSN